jgi:hypothetical protein
MCVIGHELRNSTASPNAREASCHVIIRQNRILAVREFECLTELPFLV